MTHYPYLTQNPWLPERRMAQAIHNHLDGGPVALIEVEDIIRTVRMPYGPDHQLWDTVPHALQVKLVAAVLTIFCVNETYHLREDDEDDDDLFYRGYDRSCEAIAAVGVFLNPSKVGAP